MERGCDGRLRSALGVVALAALGLFSAPGCTSLRSFDEIRASLPVTEFVQLDGQWVHFIRQGEGDPLILLHGFGGSAFSYRRVIDGLSQSFDVIAIDLNGFGYTERPRNVEAYSPEGQIALVTRFMDRFGITKAHIAGHSYGGGLAMLMAANHASRVETVVIVDGALPRSGSGGGGVPQVFVPLVSGIVRDFVITKANVQEFLEQSVADPTTVDSAAISGYYERLRVEGLGDAIAGFLSPKGGGAGVGNFDYGAVKRPAVIIWGEHDAIIPISEGELLHERIKGSFFERFENSGHLPMEEEPGKFVEVVEKYLKD